MGSRPMTFLAAVFSEHLWDLSMEMNGRGEASESEEFASRLLRLEQELGAYANLHHQELEELRKTLDQLKDEFLRMRRRSVAKEDQGIA